MAAYDCSAGGFMPPVQAPPALASVSSSSSSSSSKHAPSTRVYKSLNAHRASPFIERLQQQQQLQRPSLQSNALHTSSACSGGDDDGDAGDALTGFSLARIVDAHRRAACRAELIRLRRLNERAVIREVSGGDDGDDGAATE